MKKLLYILLIVTLSCSSDDDGIQNCTCTVDALDENLDSYTIPNFPIDCITRQPDLNSDAFMNLPANNSIGGCIN